jgi:hypothetical protein
MQKPVGGRSLLAEKTLNSMFETRTYLEPIRNSLQKPIGGLSATLPAELYKAATNKGAKFFLSANFGSA